MNNTELELMVKEILAEANMFDMIEKTISLEKEYKNSNFYKKTRMPLADVVKYAKIYYSLNIKEIFKLIQKEINQMDVTKLENLMDQMAETFGVENQEIMSTLKEFKELQ